MSTAEIMTALFDDKNGLMGAYRANGGVLTMALILRGNFDGMGVDEQFRAYKGREGRKWHEFCGDCIMHGY